MKEKIKLFCIPYAGGSANMYNSWQSELAENIELYPIELAGRGTRISESHYENLEEAVNDIFYQIADDITISDYAIFGHSLGALLTYELTQKIMSMGLRAPLHTFFSGRKPPHIPRKEKWSLLNSSDFQEKILSLGGTPPEFFQYPELKNIFIPLLRSDFSLSETESNRSEINPLSTNISILLGQNEGISHEVAVQWREYTKRECTIHFVDGNHFFLLHQQEAVINIINDSLVEEHSTVML
ncbi:thioesterase domain-containing protein [Aquimarina addita]|uniref:Thioesterase domain-containing protein n=1 Tax=Aquimarina addita TaxID=870485 RepID=A0ABP7XGP6_9FLAO